jgi:endonuclease/exonuclease/phosphatase family metal-dependent hydrolase
VDVLTYNVCHAGMDAEQGGYPWADRRDAVAATVRYHDPAVVCFQECWRGQTRDLRERLPEYEWVGAERSSGWHTPVAYDPGRLTLRGQTTFMIAPDPDQSEPAWDAAFPRWATRAEFERADVYSVHLDHRGSRARREGANLLLSRVRNRGRPAVVAGDFNCSPGSPPHDRLTDRLYDARTAHDHGPTATFSGFEGVAGLAEGRRLDYVFSTVEPTGEAVGTDMDGDCQFPSDHCPVRARVPL